MVLIDLIGILFVLLVNAVLLGVMRQVSDWTSRRTLQYAVLLIPLVVLGLILCSFNLTSWGSSAGITLLFMVSGIALGAAGLGVARLILMTWIVSHRTYPAVPKLQAMTTGLARKLGATRPQVRLSCSDKPLALTCGIRHPTIVLSPWMVEHLDPRELEAVVVHELEHVARHDYLIIWLAAILRDAFFYLPTGWIAYRHLQQEKELACDDAVVRATQRPLALASALAKVWLQAVDKPGLAKLGGAQALSAPETSIDGRIKRLLAPPASVNRQRHASLTTFSISAIVLLPFGMFEGACLAFLLLSTVVGCHPIALCGRL